MRDLLRSLLANRRGALGLAILGVFVVGALLGPLVLEDPTAFVGAPHLPPSRAHLLGTTGQGQDVLAQTVIGARTTLAVGLSAGALVVALGALVGVTAGYLGGLVDDALSLLTNVFLVIPGLPLAVVLAAYLPVGPASLVAVLVVSGFAWHARVFRAQALALRGRDFVAAAIAVGESTPRIVVREVLPNMTALVVSSMVGATTYAVGAEVGLEFLGLGDVGAVTWGTNLYWSANDAALLTGAWWILLPTGLSIALVGFALTLVGTALDELANPRLAAKSAGDDARAKRGPGGRADAAPVLEVDHLTVEYPGPSGAKRAVDDVSFAIRAGEVVGLVGESGSGKSTVGQAVLRLLAPPGRVAAGEVRFHGEDVLALEGESLRRFRWAEGAMVFQSAMNALSPVMTVRAQIEDVLVAHGTTSREALAARAEELVRLVDLPTRALDAFPHELSGGMRQRAVIAIALALRPDLVVLDEPTTALDVVVQKQILRRLLALKAELGFAVLFISHDLPLVLAFADRVGVLHQGRLVDLAPSGDLATSARDPYTKRLLASFPRVHGPAPTRDRKVRDDRAPALRVEGLRKSYAVRGGLFARDRRPVLRGVSLEVASGEIVALVGESGSGKSTIARQLLRLEVPDAGRVLLDGEDAIAAGSTRAPLAYRGRVQIVFQDPFASLNPVHTVGYHLARPLLRHRRAAKEHVDARVVELLESVGLTPGADFARRLPHTLSGGQRQRVAVARALAAEPRVLVADEPTSMLDASLRVEVLALFRRLADERGIAILFVTHDLASARAVADRVLVLYAGTVVEEGPAEAVVTAPAHPYTRLLLGSVVEDRASLEAEVGARDDGAPAREGRCPFAPRCLDRHAPCDGEPPPDRLVTLGHRSRCHLTMGVEGAPPHAAIP